MTEARATRRMYPASRETLFERLEELGIPARTVDHKPVFTVSESAAIDCDLPGGHTKNLFLKDARGALYLIIAHTETQIDLKGLPKRLGSARLSFGNAKLLQTVLGVQPGSVTAFSLMNDTEHQVNVIIDQNLMRFDTINCHPLENNATTNIAREDLLRFIRAAGHDPKILDLRSVAQSPSL